MALKKIAEYTFDNSVGDCLPTISPTMSMTTEDEAISSTETRRTISIDETLFPTHIHFMDKTSLLTVDFVKIDSMVNSMMNMFRGCSNLTSVNFSGCDASGVTTMQNMFLNCSKITSIDLSGLNFAKVTTMQQAFSECSSLKTINLTDFNTSLVKSMYQLFNNCTSLSKLDLSSFDTHSVTNMGFMFFGCSKLTTLDLSNFNTTQATNMNAMFRECSSLRFLKISSFDTGKVTNMAEMFRACSSLEELDLSNFNVTKVQYMQGMFNECVNLKSINLSSFKTSEATNMSTMFRNCETLTSLDLSAFETSKVTDFSTMFAACKVLTSLDLSNFKSDVVSNINYMFHNTPLLTTIDISNFKVLSTTTTTNAFANTYGLIDVGMLYCDNETINIVTSQLQSNATGSKIVNIYYLEADESELIAQSNITFKKYIAHSTMQLPPHIQLYSLPNGVKDELDLKTGILTRRIQKIDGEFVELETPTTEKIILNYNNSCDYAIKLPTGAVDKYDVVNSLYTQNVNSILLDGSNSWESLEDLGTTIKFTATGSSVGIDNLNMKGSGGLYCDNGMFPNINDDSDVEHCRVDKEGNKFYFFVNRTRLMSPDLIGWQYWLISNSFTLYYERNESETYSKLYEELDPAQASWEMLDCMRGGEIAHDTNGTDGITLYPTMEYVAPSINNFNISVLEPTTEYTIYAKNTNSNQTLNLGGVTHSFTNGSKYFSGKTQWVTFNGCDTVDKVVIIKGDTTNDYVPYFEGMQSVKMPVLKTVGKNLIDFDNINDKNNVYITVGRIKVDTVDKTINGLNDNYNDMQFYVYLEKGKTYKFSANGSYNVIASVLEGIQYSSNSEKVIQTFNVNDSFVFKGETGTHSLHITNFRGVVKDIQLEGNSLGSFYEPFKSNILTCNEEVILCGMDEARDELNLVTGEFTQRIQERILDGTETWITGNVTETYQIFRCESFTDMVGASRKIICDKYPYSEPAEASANLNITFSSTTGKLCIVTSNLNLSIDDFKAQLSADKPKVQYILAEPTVKTVNLQYNICAYEKLYRAISRTPSDTVHIQVSSEPNSLSPLLELECSTASASTEDYATIENNIKFDGIDKATLKGQTLVNLLPHCTYSKIASENSWELVQDFTQTLIIGKKYFISVNVVKNTFVDGGQSFYIDSKSSGSQYGIIEFTGKQGRVSSVFTPSVEGFRIACSLTAHSGEGQIELTDIILMEYQEGMENWDIPYFTGIQSVKTPILTTTGKNLLPNIEYKNINNGDIDNITKGNVRLFNGVTYTCRVNDFSSTDGSYRLGFITFKNGENISGTGEITSPTGFDLRFDIHTRYQTLSHSDLFQFTFTANDDIELYMFTTNDSHVEIQIEEGSVATPYEPHKSNTLSYNEEVTLRAVGDVKDELNLVTGEFIQRISEVVLNGSESYNVSPNATDGYSHFTTQIRDISNIPHILCTDRFILGGDAVYEGREEGTYYNGDTWVHFTIATSKLSENTVNGFKEWLSKNPVTILYQLATPISKVIDLTYINENNEELSYNYTTMTNSTNIVLNGNTPITPNVIYALPSKNSFYLVNIKTGTRYTLKYPSGTGQISIGNLSYAVTGSSVLFMTPFEITGDKNAIVFSDEDPQDVILVEGDYSNIEVPYFTGIKSVENPVIEVYNKLTTETVQYKATTSVTLRSLPNGVADTLDIVTGMLTQMINQRPYEEGDESLTDVWTDGENTIYGLTSPIMRNITFPTPMITSFSTIKVFSNHLIPQLKYRALSSNNFPLDLLQPNKTYTLYATVSNIGSYTLGGTYTSNFFGTTAISLGDVTSKSLIFNSDVGASNVMLIEGDTTKSTVPYFLGILSVEDIIMYIKGYKGEMNSMTLDDDVVLNGFGENRDIIDLTTGILTKKTNQIVLVGTENWIKFDDVNITDDYVLFRLNIPDLEASSVLGLKCDKFSHVYAHQQLHQSEGIYSISTVLNLCVKKSTIGGDNVTMLKLWLSRNNVKVVYPLATPVTIQLKNLWLSMPPTSYYTKTIIIDSTTGNISLKPIFTATVATTALEEVVSNLETQNEQLEQENIATMLALTDMYEMMSMSMPMTMSLGDDEEIEVTEVTSIGMVYAKLINKGLKTIDQVPYFLQAEVKYALSQM